MRKKSESTMSAQDKFRFHMAMLMATAGMRQMVEALERIQAISGSPDKPAKQRRSKQAAKKARRK